MHHLQALPRPLPLIPVEIPRLFEGHRPDFSWQGWANLPFDEIDQLGQSLQNLLVASRKFFDFPLEEKNKLKTQFGS